MQGTTEAAIAFSGTRANIVAMKRFFGEYNMGGKRLAEFSELDKIVYQNIERFSKMI